MEGDTVKQGREGEEEEWRLQPRERNEKDGRMEGSCESGRSVRRRGECWSICNKGEKSDKTGEWGEVESRRNKEEKGVKGLPLSSPLSMVITRCLLAAAHSCSFFKVALLSFLHTHPQSLLHSSTKGTILHARINFSSQPLPHVSIRRPRAGQPHCFTPLNIRPL